ncbi:hypothetical protein ACS0PU_000216 [Formica fusca]
MVQDGTIKKARSSRTTLLQYSKMLDFFYLNKGLAEGRFNTLHGKEVTQKKWAELAAELNNVQGATKSAEQWQVVWRDLKSRTSIKARDLRRAKAMTGNKSIKQSAELSEMELRVIGIVGAEYIEGNKDCAENIPEEESLQNELIRGNSLVLTDAPRVINVCNTLPQENLQEDPQTSNEDRVNFLDTDIDIATIDDVVFDGNASDNENIPVQQNVDKIVNERQAKRKCTSRVLPASKPSDLPSTNRNIGSSVFSRRSNRVGRSEFHSSKEQFECIAQKQADAMMMLAEASKAHAEAATINAHAMAEMAKAATKLANNAEVQAVNDADRIRVMEKVVQVLENLLPSYIH